MVGVWPEGRDHKGERRKDDRWSENRLIHHSSEYGRVGAWAGSTGLGVRDLWGRRGILTVETV